MFNYTDHLGNVRVSYSDLVGNGVVGQERLQNCRRSRFGGQTCIDYFTSSILEENNYYPFGLKHSGYNGNNSQWSYKYKYNGKEFQDELGLNVTAMDWRQYDPAIGRFLTIDPETDELEQLDKSAYAFAWNNPILYNDPDGRNPIKNFFKKLFSSTSKAAVKQVAKTEVKELLKSQKSLKNLIVEHKQKLNDFNKDPIGNSSKEALEKMTKDNPSKEVLLQRAKGRATALEKQITKQEGELAKVNELLANNGNLAKMAIPLIGIQTKSLTGNKSIDAFGRNVANFSSFVENVGVRVFGNNDFGKSIDELNPINIGISPILVKAYND